MLEIIKTDAALTLSGGGRGIIEKQLTRRERQAESSPADLEDDRAYLNSAVFCAAISSRSRGPRICLSAA